MIRPFCHFEAVGDAKWSMSALVCAIPTMRISTVVRGKAVRNAGISGRHVITKLMRKIQSIGQNIEPWERDKVQMPGTKIALERAILDALSLSHSKWDCKYHVVFIPKGRKKALYGKIRRFLGPVLRELAGQRGSTILEGHMVQDHVHMLIRIPPKYAVAEVIGYIKGKSAIAVARQFGGRQRNFGYPLKAGH